MEEYVPQLLRYIFGLSTFAEKMHDDGEEDGNVMKEHSDMEYMDNMAYEVKDISNHIIDAIIYNHAGVIPFYAKRKFEQVWRLYNSREKCFKRIITFLATLLYSSIRAL